MSTVRTRPRSAAPFALLALVTIPLTIVAYLVTAAIERDRIEAALQSVAERRIHAVETELTRGLQLLEALRALFDSSDEVLREEFRLFTASVLRRERSIVAFEWAPRVPPEQQAEHEAGVRAGAGLADYCVHRLDGSPLLDDRESDRFSLFPVVFAEPLEGNEAVLGLDLASSGERREALSLAAALGDAVLTPPIQLVQDEGDAAGAIAFLAKRSEAVSSEGHFDSGLEGVVLMVILYPDLIDVAFGGVERPQSIHFRVVDRTDPGQPGLLHTDVSDESWATLGEQFGDPVVHDLLIGQRTLSLAAYGTAEFRAANASSQPWLVSGATLMITTLIGASLLLFLRNERLAVAREHDSFLRSVLTSISEGVVVADRQAQVLFSNPVAEQLLGPIRSVQPLDWPAVCGLHLDDAKTPCPVERMPLVRAIRGEQVGLANMFVRNVVNPDGVWLSISGAPLLDDEQRLQGGVMVLRDITQRKRVEAQIRRLSLAVEQAADMILITDRGGRIVYVNPAFARMTGWEIEEVIGQTPRMLKSGLHEGGLYQSIWSTLLAGEVFQGTIVNRRKDGSRYHAEQTITPITDHSDGSLYFVSVARDISDRLEREAQQAEMRLASTIQERLYPAVMPQVDGFDVAGACFPAGATCSDYYDFIPIGDGALALVVGDVVGRGLGPALLMAETRAYMRSLLASGRSVGDAVSDLDTWITPDLGDDGSVTLLVVLIDLCARTFDYVNAGHSPGFVMGADGRARAELGAVGAALGQGTSIGGGSADPVSLDEGDTVVMVTDGIVGARSPGGEPFGIDRVEAVVREHREDLSEVIVRRLHVALDEFVGSEPVTEDRTVIICRVAETAAARAAVERGAEVEAGEQPGAGDVAVAADAECRGCGPADMLRRPPAGP